MIEHRHNCVVRIVVNFNDQTSQPAATEAPGTWCNLISKNLFHGSDQSKSASDSFLDYWNCTQIKSISCNSFKSSDTTLTKHYFLFPPDKTYSADIQPFFKVALSPLLIITGFLIIPNSLKRLKFCMFLAPTCKYQTYFSNFGIEKFP